MIKFILSLLCISLIGCGKPITTSEEASFKGSKRLLKGASDELIQRSSLSLNFDLLPLKGENKDKKKFWSMDRRHLNSRKQDGLSYNSPSRIEALSLSATKIEMLAPTEKYDLLMGRYDYPLKMEVERRAKEDQSWDVFYYGWFGASLNHNEPVALRLKNPDGVIIPFRVSEIKALLSYAYSKILITEGYLKSSHCDDLSFSVEDSRCEQDDLTALTFHTILANTLGLRGESFIADLDRYKNVKNRPLVSYQSTIINHSRTSTSRMITLLTKIFFKDVSQNINSMSLRYQLTLDLQGNMITSRWLGRERPDYLWAINKREEFPGNLSGIKLLLKK